MVNENKKEENKEKESSSAFSSSGSESSSSDMGGDTSSIDHTPIKKARDIKNIESN